MKTVLEVLATKADRSVYTIAPSASVFEALKLMAEKDVGALLVMEGHEIAGIISERDYARKMVLLGRTSRDTSVRDIMSSPVLCVRLDQSNEECMAIMTENRVRHLPVVGNGRLHGLVSIGDLVKDIISEQKFIIEQLEHFIAGDRT
jgi:CBS domain-containing protein